MSEQTTMVPWPTGSDEEKQDAISNIVDLNVRLMERIKQICDLSIENKDNFAFVVAATENLAWRLQLASNGLDTLAYHYFGQSEEQIDEFFEALKNCTDMIGQFIHIDKIVEGEV